MGWTVKQIQNLLGTECYAMYEQLNNYILDNYNVNQVWGDGGKYGDICLRYSRSGKTLCTVYFRQRQLSILVILGQDEREKFEEIKENFSVQVQDQYERIEIYHDGKWLMFDVEDIHLFSDIRMLLEIKKTPNQSLPCAAIAVICVKPLLEI